MKSGIKNGTKITLNLSSNVVGSWNVDANSPHKALLTNTQVSKLLKTFANNSSGNTKLSKIQLQKIGKSGEFLGIILGPLLKNGLVLMENVLKTLA